MSSNKAELRAQMRAKRRGLSATEQRHAAQALARQVTTAPWFRRSCRIACYMPNDGEIDPTAVIEHIWAMKKHAYLPVLSHITSDRLWFAEITPVTALRLNRYGISEPAVARHQLIRAQELDLVLLPLVAFDEHGHRLGMGGGFYDRSLAFLRHRSHWRKPRLIGVAHDFQCLPEVPADPWDISVSAVITDRQTYPAR
jgi:5-formyltetrahydrofolate cyclo-ligase